MRLLRPSPSLRLSPRCRQTNLHPLLRPHCPRRIPRRYQSSLRHWSYRRSLALRPSCRHRYSRRRRAPTQTQPQEPLV